MWLGPFHHLPYDWDSRHAGGEVLWPPARIIQEESENNEKQEDCHPLHAAVYKTVHCARCKGYALLSYLSVFVGEFLYFN